MTPDEFQASCCVFEAIKDRCLGTSIDEWLECTKKYEFIPIRLDDRVIGGVMKNGPEVHIGLRIRNRKFLRGILRKEMNKVVDTFGHAETWVTKEHEVGHKLAKMLNFKVTEVEADRTKYECTEVKL